MDAIQESLSQMMVLFAQRMDAFEERQASKPTTPTSDGDLLAAEFAAFKSFVVTSLKALQTQIEVLAKQHDQLEMRSRRKMLLMHGVGEEQQEDTVGLLVKTLVARLKLSGITVNDISRCHRMGRASGSDKPRPILFKLRDIATRAKIWAAKATLKGSGVTLSEFLTKSRHDMFMAARQKLGMTKCWTRDGFVFVLRPDGSRHRLNCISELDNIVQSETSKRAVPAKAPALRAPSKTRRAAKENAATTSTATSKK